MITSLADEDQQSTSEEIYPFMQRYVADTLVHIKQYTDSENTKCPLQPEQRINNVILMAYFNLNQREQNAHQYLYQDIPKPHTYNKSRKQWQQHKRQTAKAVIHKIYNVLPSDPERLALVFILLHIMEATSFEDTRRGDGVTRNTCKNAVRSMSLLGEDAEHRRCLRQAVVILMPVQMRQLFATLILSQPPSDIGALFTEFREDMAENYVTNDQLKDLNATFQQQHIHMCLADIQKTCTFTENLSRISPKCGSFLPTVLSNNSQLTKPTLNKNKSKVKNVEFFFIINFNPDSFKIS
eukprot:gene18497-biopygen15585